MVGEKDLSILIVNWNSKDYLRRCLETIYGQTHGVNFEVIIVDNASWDGAAEMVAAAFPKVRFIQSKSNLGFARANNLAFEHGVGRAVLLLNPDTEIIGEAIPTMLEILTSKPDAGIVGCKHVDGIGSIQTSCISRFPSILQEVLGMEWLRRIWPNCSLWSIKVLFQEYTGPVQVDAVSGACQLIPREVYEAVGGLSTKYFMYSEDVEICAAALARGWKTYYVGNAQIIHHGGRSTVKKGRADRWTSIMQKRALWQFYRTWRGAAYAALYRIAVGTLSMAWIAAVCVGWPVLAATQKRRTARRVWDRWTGALLWALGLEGLSRKLFGAPTITMTAAAQNESGAPE